MAVVEMTDEQRKRYEDTISTPFNNMTDRLGVDIDLSRFEPSPADSRQKDDEYIFGSFGSGDRLRHALNNNPIKTATDKIAANAVDMFSGDPERVSGEPNPYTRPQGISSMQEKPLTDIEGAQELLTNIRTGLNDPARAMSEGATEEDVAMVQSMTDSQLLEFVTEMANEAETEGMGEESPEDKALSLLTGERPYNSFKEGQEYRDLVNSPDYYDMIPGSTDEGPLEKNYGGPVQSYNQGGLASMGRMEDTELAHVAPGERIVPDWVLGDKGNEMLDAAFVRAGIDPIEYTVGSGQGSINPRTGMPEYTSFFKRLFKKVKKLAPAIGALVGFSYGGAQGAGIGKAIGGVIKTGDLDFGKALSDFGTGWSLGKMGEGFGLQGGKPGDFSSRTSIFKGSDAGGVWDREANIAMGDDANTAGGMLQNIGARIAGGKDMDLMEQFKNLPMAHKLAVGALGLNALSQTGMFDEEELGDTPPEMRQGIAELRDYHSQPLRAANQVEYSFDPSLGQPVGVTEYSGQNKSLQEILQELNTDSIGYQPSTISYG